MRILFGLWVEWKFKTNFSEHPPRQDPYANNVHKFTVLKILQRKFIFKKHKFIKFFVIKWSSKIPTPRHFPVSHTSPHRIYWNSLLSMHTYIVNVFIYILMITFPWIYFNINIFYSVQFHSRNINNVDTTTCHNLNIESFIQFYKIQLVLVFCISLVSV